MRQSGRLVLATTFIRRLKGLLFTSYDDAILLISPCRAIHTIGLHHSLDVAFIDKKGVVRRSERKLGRRFMVRDKKALAVLERRATDMPWPEEGDQILISWLSNV